MATLWARSGPSSSSGLSAGAAPSYRCGSAYRRRFSRRVFPRADPERLGRLHEHGCPTVVRHGVGLDKVDAPDGRRPGIAVENVPDDSQDEISNHASAPLAAVHRRPSAVGFDRTMRGRRGHPTDRRDLATRRPHPRVGQTRAHGQRVACLRHAGSASSWRGGCAARLGVGGKVQAPVIARLIVALRPLDDQPLLSSWGG